MQNAISVNNVTKKISQFTLSDVSFALPEGCVLGLIGENGAGKTTLIKLMLNMLKKDGGEISLLGKDSVREEEAIKRQLGVVLDECFFHETLRPRDVGRILQSIYPDWDKRQFESLLKEFRLPEKKRVKELSRGMKQKLNIAAALSHKPRLLLLDEATSGLDPVIRDEILDILREFIQDEGCSVLLSSHITSDLDKIADYVAFLHEGKLVFAEPKDALMDRFALISCTHEDAARLPASIIAGKRESRFQVELLISDRIAARRLLPGAQFAPADLEAIMLYHVKGEA